MISSSIFEAEQSLAGVPIPPVPVPIPSVPVYSVSPIAPFALLLLILDEMFAENTLKSLFLRAIRDLSKY